MSEPDSNAGLDIEHGPRLASGRDADVFDLGNGRVLRRNRVGSKASEYEAAVMRYLHAWGYPVPSVYEVSGPDMVMDRVDGPTMLHDLGTRPWMLWQQARTLAKLHHQLHGIPAPDWVPTYTSHSVFGDAPTANSSPAHREGEQAGAHPPIPDALLHLDFHPANVILSPSGPVAIDWRNTRRGDGAIDVATTWLIMATSEVPEGSLKWRVIAQVRRLFVSAFLRAADRQAAARQIPSVARYRLADRNLLDSERTAIHVLVRSTAAR